MGNVFKQRTYKCKCGALTKEYVWDNELDKIKIKCSECSNKLNRTNLVEAVAKQLIGIRTPTKNR